jgi:hypothetical protein
MRAQVVRTWLCATLLVLTPLAVYWPTVFHEYGYRDDYAHLRETREIPENLMRFTSSYGRPAYGALLIATVRQLGGEVANLQWLRLASILLLVLVGMTLMRLLQRSGWSTLESAAIGLTITLLPAAQVTVGWSIAWPVALALLLALGGFVATGAALARTGWPRLGAWAAGFTAYLVTGLIYQPSALFVVVPLAAGLLLRTDAARGRLRWTAAHLATAFGGLAASFLVMRVVFALGVFAPSGVIAFETNPLAKLFWFIFNPLANSLGLFVLRDRFDTSPLFWVAVLFVAAVIAVGFRRRVNREPIDKWTALFCLFALPFAAFAINLAAAVRVPGYRTTYGLAGLVVVFIVYSLRSLRAAGRIGRNRHYAALGVMLLAGAVLANRQAYTLIAQPHGWEWQIVRDAVLPMPLKADTKVYMVRPAIEDRATRRIFADEFGSLSSNSDWAAQEMFKSALRRRFPSGLPAGLAYTLTSGLDVPRRGAFDVVIDMRKLKQHRTD